MSNLVGKAIKARSEAARTCSPLVLCDYVEQRGDLSVVKKNSEFFNDDKNRDAFMTVMHGIYKWDFIDYDKKSVYFCLVKIGKGAILLGGLFDLEAGKPETTVVLDGKFAPYRFNAIEYAILREKIATLPDKKEETEEQKEST